MNRAAPDNPLGLGLVIVGAIALAVAVFLPLDQPTGLFRLVENNTLIQHGGWLLIAFALGIAVSGYRVSQGTPNARWVPIILCVIAAALTIYMSNDKDFRTLYPIGPDGNPIANAPGMVANLGIAIYVAGAGVAAAFIGSLMLFQSAKQLDADDPLVAAWEEAPTTKKCPDCAETILVDAKVCKHCGYRFAPPASSEPASKPPAPTQPPPHKTSEAKPPHKTPEPKPRTKPPARANVLRVEDRVQVVAPGNDYLKVGTVTRILDNDEVEVKLGKLSGTYIYGSDELQILGRNIRW